MKKNHIEKILKNTHGKIKHLQSSLLRADSLKTLLQIEYDNYKNIDLLTATKKGLTEMLNEMDKSELLSEIEYSIVILDYYVTNNSFNLTTIPINKGSQDLSEKYNEIKFMIKEIVETKQKHESSGFID